MGCRRTLESRRLAALDASQTLAELGLGRMQLCKRGSQVLELLIELFLDLAKLLSTQAVQIN